MRVLFLTLYPESVASARYRVHQFLPYLREAGIACEVACPFDEGSYRRLSARARSGRAWPYHAHELRRRLAHLFRARAGIGRASGGEYDVIVLQKALLSFYVRGMHRALDGIAEKLVYDIDDAVHRAPPVTGPRPWRWFEDRDQIVRVFRLARTTLAGNAWLASEVEAAGGRADVFPTVVDTDRFCPAPSASAGYTVGWMGGPSTAGPLRAIAPALERLEGVRVRVVGATGHETGLSTAEHVSWSYATEVEELRGFSVGLMPLDKTDWTRGKCGLKALQYMACGVPCVATPYGAAAEIIEDGVTGLFADTEAEWVEAIDAMRDGALRRRLGDAARAVVDERYSLRDAAPRLESILRSVAG